MLCNILRCCPLCSFSLLNVFQLAFASGQELAGKHIEQNMTFMLACIEVHEKKKKKAERRSCVRELVNYYVFYKKN